MVAPWKAGATAEPTPERLPRTLIEALDAFRPIPWLPRCTEPSSGHLPATEDEGVGPGVLSRLSGGA